MGLGRPVVRLTSDPRQDRCGPLGLLDDQSINSRHARRDSIWYCLTSSIEPAALLLYHDHY